MLSKDFPSKYSKLFQRIDNTFGSVAYLIMIGGSHYFSKCFSCVFCWTQYFWIGKVGSFCTNIWQNKNWQNDAIWRFPPKKIQNIDNIYDSVGFLKRIDGGWYFVKRFICASCWAQNRWMGEIGCFFCWNLTK